jgi:ribosomal protein S11
MQKQRKELNFTKYKKHKKKLSKKLIRLRKLYLKSTFSFNIYFKKILSFFKKKRTNYKKIYIRLTQNNIFCTLRTSKHKTIVTSSSGKYKIKTSKKKIKFSSKIILKSFLKEIKKKISKSKLLINIIAPKKLKKKIVSQLCQTLRNKTVIININNKKSFNGCRPKKQKRKKRKGLRIFK